MIKNMDTECLSGQMDVNTKDIGKMANNMAKEFILDQMEVKEKENGIMEKGRNGSKKIKTLMNKISKIIDHLSLNKYLFYI